MARLLSWLLIPSVILAGLVGGQSALAQKKDPAHTVQDDGGFFSPEAKDKANQIIRQIKTQFHKDFFVETQLTAPESANDTAGFFKWAVERAKNQNVNGVYLLITMKPTKFQVVVGDKTRELGYFTNKDRDDLRDLILAKLKEKKNDEALTGGATFVLDTMQRHKASAAAPVQEREPRQGANPAPANPAGEINWGKWILIGLAVLLGIWLLTALLRAFSGGAAGAPGMAGGGYGGGGGGFFSSLLGGMFGAAAGMWLYNNFFGGHTPSAHAGDSYGSSSSEPTDVGGDYSSSGGDYGGGGDAGGGDAGGGDFGGGGGGDFGGGGGDFGGGGGFGGGGE